MSIHTNLIEKETKLKTIFSSCLTQEAKYQKIIELGQMLSPMDNEYKIPERIVPGCQSIVYLRSYSQNGRLYFEAASEALISAGLASLLIHIYQGETPEVVLKHPPTVLEELGIIKSLTPGRSNGLASMYLRMKQDALKVLMSS